MAVTKFTTRATSHKPKLTSQNKQMLERNRKTLRFLQNELLEREGKYNHAKDVVKSMRSLNTTQMDIKEYVEYNREIAFAKDTMEYWQEQVKLTKDRINEIKRQDRYFKANKDFWEHEIKTNPRNRIHIK